MTQNQQYNMAVLTALTAAIKPKTRQRNMKQWNNSSARKSVLQLHIR